MTTTMPRTGLPVEEILDELRTALARGPFAVLDAPPGAGKTTLVPLALLDADWLRDRKMLMLEPRRLAARMAARRMAELLGEQVGETVGYSVRMDRRVGPNTRIEVVTEAILTRRLIDDPALDGVGAVIFDEFHERSIHTDLGLALCLEAHAALREDLRLVVMSATLDGVAIATLFGDAPVIASRGRAYPVETHYLARPDAVQLAPAVAAAVRRAVSEETGSLLVFLPGAPEIRHVQRLLRDSDLGTGVRIAPLHGSLSATAQDAALRPAGNGLRKIVLATDIAETSLTIEGVRMVIDCGYRRVPRFDPGSGMTRLETRRISRAAANQRRGRAGRLEPGVCWRLWPQAETKSLAAFETPEILQADLAPLALDLARWGTTDPGSLAWPDPPPLAGYAQARGLLVALGALQEDGRITNHGTAMNGLPMHPRLAHMVLAARDAGSGALACDIAAVLEARDILPSGGDTDLRGRVELLRDKTRTDAAGGSLKRVRTVAADLRKRLRVDAAPANRTTAGELLALAYPDRMARRRGPEGRYLLRNGRGAALPEGDPLQAEDWLAVAELGGSQADARIFLAAPLDAARVEDVFAAELEERVTIAWDARREKVTAARERRLGAILLGRTPVRDPPASDLTAAMLAGVRAMGLDALPWTRELRQWQTRVHTLRELGYRGFGWPDVSDAALTARLEEWLAPFLDGCRSRADLRRIDLRAALMAMLDRDMERALATAAPTHFTAPTGSRLALDYSAADGPILRVRLQEMLGVAETPTIAEGRVTVLVELLSPAGRPVQLTRDLAGFWSGSYAAVKAEMKGRYPKHLWPDDPMSAAPTRQTRKAMDRNR